MTGIIVRFGFCFLCVRVHAGLEHAFSLSQARTYACARMCVHSARAKVPIYKYIDTTSVCVPLHILL